MLETYQQTLETQNHEQVQPVEASLFDHYSIDNEVDFLHKIEHLPIAEQQFYIRENMLGFLGEYAGRIPYKKISYVMKDGTFDFAGIKMRDTYKKVLDNAGQGSREWNETVGMLKLEEAMQDPNVNVATVLSPPKIDNYSFAFHFVKGEYNSALGGNPISEYLLRYPEKMNSVENSKQIAKGLTFEHVDEVFTTQGDFLVNPILAYSSDPSVERARLFQLAGIDQESIKKSQEYEKFIVRELMPWIDRYFDSIFDMKNAKSNQILYSDMKGDTEMLLGAIYNRARMLREILDEDTFEHINFATNINSYSKELIQQFADSMELKVQGGSCPVVKSKDGTFGTSYMSFADIYKSILSGNTIQSITEKEPFECPKCHHKTYESVGNQCPSCKLTKEQAVEEGYITC